MARVALSESADRAGGAPPHSRPVCHTMAYMSNTEVSDVRINARLDAKAAAQLHYLTATTGLGVSEVVRASLAHYYQAQRAVQTPALRHLKPLVGAFKTGSADASSRVKQVVAEHLLAKHGIATRSGSRKKSVR